MIFSKTDKFLPLLLMTLCLPAAGRQDPVELIKRHRYDEAIVSWNADLAGGKQDEKTLRALKGKALAYFRLGSLYASLQKFSTSVMGEYYGGMSKEANASPLHFLYLGQTQYQSGNYAAAQASFETVKKKKGVSQGVVEMAEVYLSAIGRKSEGSQAAERKMLPKDNAALWQYWDLLGAPVDPYFPPGTAPSSQRGRRCKLQMLLRTSSASQTDIEKALKAVLNEADNPEAYLDKDKNTQINFYDPFLLSTLSQAHFTLSKLLDLRIREEEKKFPELAAKFNTNLALTEVCLRLGQVKEAAGFLGNDAGNEGQLLRARILAGQNKADESANLLGSLTKSAKNPEAMKDIADCYYLLGRDSEAGIKLAVRALKEKDGSNYHRTYASLLFAAGRNDAALQEYAKGYKIEYRNRIDQIDPEYMSDYAYAIYKTNKLRYEEVVETLYHLQKEFPPCRQMHYCMQGISAGLARSFESQKIFRKGG